MNCNIVLYLVHLSFIAATWSHPLANGTRFQFPDSRFNPSYRGQILNSRCSTRNIMNNLAARWPLGVVPFEINLSTGFSPYNVQQIFRAIRELEANTCIRFRDATPDDDGVAVFMLHDQKCQGLFGRQGSWQPIYMSYECWGWEHMEIMHEIIHTLGIGHEHIRPDRDEYIEVLWENIQPHAKYNFMKNENMTQTYGFPYDYDSVMHYLKDSFRLREGLDTIRVKDPIKGANIGLYKKLSPLDAKKINALYADECAKRTW